MSAIDEEQVARSDVAFVKVNCQCGLRWLAWGVFRTSHSLCRGKGFDCPTQVTRGLLLRQKKFYVPAGEPDDQVVGKHVVTTGTPGAHVTP